MRRHSGGRFRSVVRERTYKSLCGDCKLIPINHIHEFYNFRNQCDYEKLAGCVQAPVSLKPTVEWQQYQVSDFSKLRLYVSQLKDEILIGKRKWRPPDIDLVYKSRRILA